LHFFFVFLVVEDATGSVVLAYSCEAKLKIAEIEVTVSYGTYKDEYVNFKGRDPAKIKSYGKFDAPCTKLDKTYVDEPSKH
jgi:hypothetical protein